LTSNLLKMVRVNAFHSIFVTMKVTKGIRTFMMIISKDFMYLRQMTKSLENFLL